MISGVSLRQKLPMPPLSFAPPFFQKIAASPSPFRKQVFSKWAPFGPQTIIPSPVYVFLCSPPICCFCLKMAASYMLDASALLQGENTPALFSLQGSIRYRSLVPLSPLDLSDPWRRPHETPLQSACSKGRRFSSLPGVNDLFRPSRSVSLSPFALDGRVTQ